MLQSAFPMSNPEARARKHSQESSLVVSKALPAAHFTYALFGTDKFYYATRRKNMVTRGNPFNFVSVSDKEGTT